MLRRILASALVAGLVAGAVAFVAGSAFVTPLIVEAERYETGELVHYGGALTPEHEAEHALHPHAREAEAHEHAAPAGDLTRMGLTALAALVTHAGFGLLLVAGFALAERAGHAVNGMRGLAWGLAGFAAIQFLPAFGLPPELPGSGSASLEARQIWWLLTVAASAAGLWLLLLGAAPAQRGLGAVLILAPHLIGAPHPDGFAGTAPPELAGLFAARSLGIGALAWAVLGGLAGHLWARDAARHPALA